MEEVLEDISSPVSGYCRTLSKWNSSLFRRRRNRKNHDIRVSTFVPHGMMFCTGAPFIPGLRNPIHCRSSIKIKRAGSNTDGHPGSDWPLLFEATMERVCRCPVARKNLAFKSCLEPASEVFEFFSFHARPPRLPAPRCSPLLLAGRNVCVVHRFASFHPESREGQLFRGGAGGGGNLFLSSFWK